MSPDELAALTRVESLLSGEGPPSLETLATAAELALEMPSPT